MTTVVYGLDGADPELVDRWEEELPNFKKLKEEGFFGGLESIRPPITVPAWMCMLSGKAPESFSAYDFQYLDFDNYRFKMVDSSFFKGRSLIDSDEKKIISYRVPGTTPGYSINGDMVTGFVKGEEIKTVPKNLEEELKEEIDIEMNPITGEGGEKQENSVHNFKQNNRAFKWLLENKEFDRAFSVFRLIDTWMHNVDREEEMLEAYKLADRKLGDIIDLCKEKGWNLVVVSDHGSGNTDRKLYLNAWLRERGYAKYVKQEEKASNRLINSIVEKAMKLGLKPLLKKAADLYQSITGRSVKPHKSDTMEKIDWNETEAFSYLSAVSNYGAIWIHDKDRFPNGVVEDRDLKAEEIREKLEKEDYIQNVYTNKEIYQNGEMPDIIVEGKENLVIGPEIYTSKFHDSKAVAHNSKGIIGCLGPGFRQGKELEAELIDVAGTVQALEGEVNVFDGRVLKEVLKEPKPDYEESLKV